MKKIFTILLTAVFVLIFSTTVFAEERIVQLNIPGCGA